MSPLPTLTGDMSTDRALVNLAQLLLEIARNPKDQAAEIIPSAQHRQIGNGPTMPRQVTPVARQAARGDSAAA